MLGSNMIFQVLYHALLACSLVQAEPNLKVCGNSNDIHESSSSSSLKRVFVYGTLKSGQPNHGLLTNTSNGYAKFIGLGETLYRYPLVIASKYNIPFLLKQQDVGHQVLGELYGVDSKMMDKLDELEGHPSFYVRTEEDIIKAREQKDVTIEKIECVTKAWTYFLPKFKAQFLELPMYSSYSNEGDHNLTYIDGDIRDETYDLLLDVQ